MVMLRNVEAQMRRSCFKSDCRDALSLNPAQVKVISSDPRAEGMKLRVAQQNVVSSIGKVSTVCTDRFKMSSLGGSEVSSNGKEMKAEDTQKQRQEIEAETKA